MDITKLKKGLIIKNYKAMCEILDEPIKEGRNRKLQLKDWERYFDWSKDGHKFIIDRVYKKPKSKVDGRGKSKGSRNNNLQHYPNFKLSKQNWYANGVYSIKLNNNIYIGSTTVGFRNRFLQHKNGDTITHDMLQQGATFEILWLDNTHDEPFIRQMESKYINYYRNKTEWNVVNEKDSWSYTQPKMKYKSIKVDKNKLDNVINFLEENNIEYKI